MEKAPARIFVLWHPDYSPGREIAAAIFDWFRTPDGQGLPVYFRSAPDPSRKDDLPPPVPDDRSTLNFVILLAEYHMVRDRSWREWLTELASRKFSSTILYPVALHRTAFKLPDPIRQQNLIRIQTDREYADHLNEQELEALLTGLRKSLTEVFSRALTNELLTTGISKFLSRIITFFRKTPDEPPKLKIFISHAKRDKHAVKISKRLRDYIYQETQLSAFFDENDIALGYRFGKVLETALRSGVAAMIAVNSDHYAARPWCRREVQVFSRPFDKPAHQDVWLKSPLLVLQAMKGGSTSSAIPDFGNSPMMRWREGDESRCIDTLLRDSIFRSFHAALASLIRNELKKNEAGKKAPRRMFINWVPDPLSLNDVVKKLQNLETKADKFTDGLEIVYPGGGLSLVELQSLRKSYPKIQLKSFSEIRADWGSDIDPDERWLDQHVIGISASNSDDLLGLGFGPEHIREFLMRLARPLLRAGANLAYGGHFKNNAITRDIIELISDEQREGTTSSEIWQGKLYNHSPWPYYSDITKEDEADFIDVCRFIPISQELAEIPPHQLISDLPNQRLESRVNGAVVLSAMRQFMAKGMLLERKGKKPDEIPKVYARILVGGKIQGFSGVLPGIYEEALYCLEQRRPLFILGGYGGAGAKIAGYLREELNTTDAMLEIDVLRQSTPALVDLETQYDELDLPDAARKPSRALSDLIKQLNRCRKNLKSGLNNGLSKEENLVLFNCIDTTEAAALIVRGLHKCVKRDEQAESRIKSAAKKKPPGT